MKNNIGKNCIGKSGECFVASELFRRNITASLLLGNTENFDILAINMKSNNTYSIQVKTIEKYKSKNNHSWPLDKKCENIISNNFYYVFVKLNGLENPEYYIVPSKIVANKIKIEHENWLKQKGKNGKKHKDNNMRDYTPEEEYKNAWNYFK